jgi:hypothetical protein
MPETSILFNDTNLGLLFVIAILVSTILAYGFHFMVSLLSLATGISLTPNLKKAAAKAKADSMKRNDRTINLEEDDDDDDSGVNSIVITSAVGLWTLLSSSIALFLATWLGISLVPSSPAVGVIAGLTVWALFFFSITYLEFKAINTLIGGLINAAVSGLRASGNAIQKTMSNSKEQEAENIARRSVKAIYEEVQNIFSKDDIDRKVEDYLTKITPDNMNFDRIRSEIEGILDEVRIHERYNIEDDELNKIYELHIQKHPQISRANAKKLKDTINEAYQASKGKDKNLDKGYAAIKESMPVDNETMDKYKAKLSQMLNDTSKDELNSDKLAEVFENLTQDPNNKENRQEAINALMHFDEKSIAELLQHSGKFNQSQSEQVVSISKKVVNKLQTMFANDSSSETHNTKATMVQDRSTESNADKQKASEKLKSSVSTYLDSLDIPELNYQTIKSDLQRIYDNPSHASELINHKLGNFKKDDVANLLSRNPYLSYEQASKIADEFDNVKNKAEDTYNKVQTEVKKRYENSRRKAIAAAETTRKNAITASWWLVASAITSAAAAALGGMLGS